MPKSPITTLSLDILEEAFQLLKVSSLAKQLNRIMVKNGMMKQYKYKRWDEKRISKMKKCLVEAFKSDESDIYFPHGLSRFKVSLTNEETLRKLEKELSGRVD